VSQQPKPTEGTLTCQQPSRELQLDHAAAQALQLPLAELPAAGIGRVGVAVTLAPVGALLVLVAS
jgi:hypothetical protein